MTTFGDLSIGASFKFHATSEACVKTSSKRYHDAHGVTQLCQAKLRPVLVDGATAIDQVEAPVARKLTTEVVADLWAARVMRWRCPTCLHWVTCPIGRRCTDCAAARTVSA